MKTKQLPLYVCLPMRLLKQPPIAHRGSNASARISPFQCKLMSAVLAEAWAVVSDANFAKAWRKGGKDIASENALANQYKEDWQHVDQQRDRGQHAEAPERYHTFGRSDDGGWLSHSYKPKAPRPKALKRAGRTGFWGRLKWLRRHGPTEPVWVEISCCRLLRSAGIAKKGTNLRKLEAVLDRLCQPVGGGAQPSEPPLLLWKIAENGKLRLLVSAEWLRPPFKPLPLPLPNNATALALLLWLSGIRTDPFYAKQQAIGFRQLCQRLDLPRWGDKVATDTIRAALNTVNKWLKRLRRAAPQHVNYRAALYQYEIELPAYYEIEPVDDDTALRFISTDYQLSDRETGNEDKTVEEIVDEQMEDKETTKAKRQRYGRRYQQPAELEDEEEEVEVHKRPLTHVADGNITPDSDDEDERPVHKRPLTHVSSEEDQDRNTTLKQRELTSPGRERERKLEAIQHNIALCEAARQGDRNALHKLGLDNDDDDDE
jgi:hypothetical protein